MFFDTWDTKKRNKKNFKSGKSSVNEAFTPLLTQFTAFSWQFLSSPAGPHLLTSPLPRHLPKFWPSGAWDKGKPRWRLTNGALVQLHNECASILQERGLVFQSSGLLTSGFRSGSFNGDKKTICASLMEDWTPLLYWLKAKWFFYVFQYERRMLGDKKC